MDDASVQREIDALERVLFRLASVDDTRLLVVLDALLPQLLRLFPTSPAHSFLEGQLKDKILHVITHIKTRLHAIPTPKLPLTALGALLLEPDCSVFTYNFAFLFIEMGFAAASTTEQTRVLGEIITALSRVSSAQHETFFRLLMRALPIANLASIVQPTTSSDTIDMVLDFLLDLVLYQPSSSTSESATTVYGLMAPRCERLTRVKVTEMKRDTVYETQLHALHFAKHLISTGVTSSRVWLLFVAGASSFHHAVKTCSEDQLARLIKDPLDPSPLENTQLCRDLMCLILGSQVAQSAGAFQGRDTVMLGNRTRVADSSLLAAVGILTASKAATNTLPLMLQVLCQLMFAAEPSRPQNIANRVKLAGVRLCEWTFHHSDTQYLVGLLGPVLLNTLLRVLMDPNADTDTSNIVFTREFRQGMYECLSVLATRVPQVVSASVQPFQVVLVRCLVEEESRNGANALKAFSSLRGAYSLNPTPAVLDKVQSELIGVLRGTKLFDASKRYERVRAAVAEWTHAIISARDGSDDVDLRFALFPLAADTEEAVRVAVRKALYAEPLPSIATLAKKLEGMFGSQKDLKRSSVGLQIAEQVLIFAQHVMKARTRDEVAQGDVDMDAHSDERRELVTYFVETLCSNAVSGSLSSDAQRAQHVSLCQSLANRLLELAAMTPDVVKGLLVGREHDVVRLATSVSVDRSYLSHMSKLLELAVPRSSVGNHAIAATILENVLDTLTNAPSSALSSRCGALYFLGKCVGMLKSSSMSSDSARELVCRALGTLTSTLSDLVTTSSKFAQLPRGEEAQNALVDQLRSALDAVGLIGHWTELVASPHIDALGIEIVKCLQTVIEWKPESISSDGNLKQKLCTLRRVALESTTELVAGFHMPQATSAEAWQVALTGLLASVLHLGGESKDPELPFTVAHTLLGFGACYDFKHLDTDDPLATTLLSVIIQDYCASRFPSMRRSATTWLLSMSAIGLGTSTGSDGEAGLAQSVASCWSSALHSHQNAKTLVAVHEFFVTMLNDADSVAKESAVKGLAYLRLRAPTPDLGEQFSESLFRRLRCFRAFAPSRVGGTGANADANEDDGTDTPSAESTSTTGSSGSSTTATGDNGVRDTVENAAYREVSNIAADIGDPELMYALLYLSTTDPVWDALALSATTSTSLSTCPTFADVDRRFRASIITQANQEWMSEGFVHREKLVPWLFLLKNHSNSKVADVMTSLWQFAKGELSTTNAQEKSLLRQQWSTIFRFLLQRLEVSRNFKYREAACAALMDLLNGATADDIQDEFVRLWKLTSRSVDDIMEAVVAAGLKLFKYLGELSLRVASVDHNCRAQLLDFLIADGMTSKNVVCRALSIDLLTRLIKELPASAVQERLAALMLRLLEYLSSLEMPELQYAQFHVDKKDQLERLRVSLSQSGPVGLLLEQCTIQLKALAGSDDAVKIVEELARGAVNLLKFGVGLNTRVGTANFVTTLATELPFELRKCRAPELLLTKALIPYVGDRSASENDQYGDDDTRYGPDGTGVSDGVVLQAYCRAAAYLCALAETSHVKLYVREGIFAYVDRTKDVNAPVTAEEGPKDGVYASRFLMVSAMAIKELVAKCPPITDASTMINPDNRNAWYCTDVFPAAFVGQFASAESLKTTWSNVLEELPPSILYASASLEATLRAISRLIRHPAWGTRAQAVKALHALFASSSSYKARITASQTDQIWLELMAAVPGRLWKGKGVILEALVAVTGVRIDGAPSLSSLLLEECDRAWRNRDMEYLESALLSLGALTETLPPSQVTLQLDNVLALRARLLAWSIVESSTPVIDDQAMFLAPMMIKTLVESLARCWPSASNEEQENTAKFESIAADTIHWLLNECIPRPSFHVWSVRRALFTALAAVVSTAPLSVLSNNQLMNRLVTGCCGDLGVGDAKYSMVRTAAGHVLAALTKRPRSSTDPKHSESTELALLVVVHRERISAAVHTLRGADEPKETQVAMEIFNNLNHTQGLQL